MMAAIRMMVVLPNHIMKFISAMRKRLPKGRARNSYAGKPRDSMNLLTGPPLENSTKNSIEKAEAMIRLGM